MKILSDHQFSCAGYMRFELGQLLLTLSKEHSVYHLRTNVMGSNAWLCFTKHKEAVKAFRHAKKAIEGTYHLRELGKMDRGES